MIRHIALFRFTPGTTSAQIDELDAGLRSLPDRVSAIEAFRCGADLSLTDGSWDYAIVADFADVEAYHAYQVDPEHVETVMSVVQPVVAEAARVQYAIG
jgi:hypothetical protein